MPFRRIKIELYGDDGNKIAVSFKGGLTRQKVLELLDFIDLFDVESFSKQNQRSLSDLSKFDKVKFLLSRRFPIGWFTTQEVLIAYEDSYDEPIDLSTVSTYLTRLANQGMLSRSGSRSKHQYKLRRKTAKRKGKIKYRSIL
ncbi:MAG: hypothetical protein ACFFBD_30100 [Candidatus Hodarchaeota archaeon]